MRKIIKNLKIWQQLLIVSILFAIPIIVLLFFLLSSHNKSIQNTKYEISGLEFLDPVHSIISSLPKYHCYALSSKICNINANTELKTIEIKIDSYFDILINSLNDYSNILNINDKILTNLGKEYLLPNKLKQQWEKYKSIPLTSEISLLKEEYLALLNNILSLNRYIANESHLILDPDLDSYYLMDISILVMPETFKQISDIIHLCASVSSNDSTKDNKSDLFQYYSTTLENDLVHRINYGIDVARRFDYQFYGLSSGLQKDIPIEMKSYENSLKDYLRRLKTIQADISLNFVNDIKNSTISVLSSGDTFWRSVTTELKALLHTRYDDYVFKKYQALIIGIALAIIAFILVFLISSRISKTLIFLRKISDSIAEGDMAKATENLKLAIDKGYLILDNHLTKQTIKDELLILFQRTNTMTINLKTLINQLKSSAQKVADSTFKISNSARELETTVAEQAASTNEVNATSREISANSSSLAKTMNKISAMASESADIVDKGLKGLAEINSTMSSLIASAKIITEKLHTIQEKSENITQVIETITKVANQTNLLSLNAAIEAEKAGKFGIGFSVVAQEIRRLADQTSVAALDIEDMIKEMQSAVNEGVTVVENYSNETKISSEKTVFISNNITNAIDQIRKLEPELEDINEGMQMQSEAANQIKEAMEQLNIVANQTRDALIEFNKATNQLNEVVSMMNEEINKFIFDK